MDVINLPISKFLKTANSLIIPVYQRDYTWKKDNCEKLWQDIQQLVTNKRSNHFLGTVVTINEGYGEYLVIDGQQRLTTISIFLLALIHHLNSKETKTEEDIQLQKIFKSYLIDEESVSNNIRIKLKPNRSDSVFFEKLFNDDINSKDNESNILNNYLYFRQELAKDLLHPKDIFEKGLIKLLIVSINLTRGQDDPQLIFESLNSTGVDLTAGDLIRNYILMDLQPEEQEKLYKQYWLEIDKLTNNIAEYIRNYLIYKTKTWVKKDDVYVIFKKYALDQFNNDKLDLLKDLIYYASIYSYLVQINKHTNLGINTSLERLNKIEFTVSYPYLLDLFNDLNNNVLDEKTVKRVLVVLESYVFRKLLVDNSTQGLNKMFITLSKEIKKEESWKQQYNDILNYILLEKGASQRFPNDEEFENALINKEVYRFQAKNRNFLLESLEHHNSSYKVPILDLTVEHIMPQTLTKDWKQNLGPNWQEVHKKYLHTLGNLSLTAKNSELSNNSFEDKQIKDFQTSKLKLNFKLDGVFEWNEDSIVSRAKHLAKLANEIWAYPTTKYTRPVPQEQKFDLTSEDDFSGTKPSKLYLEEDEQGIELRYWRDLLIQGCKHLHNFSPTQFNEIQRNPEFKWNFDVNKPLRSPCEFLPGKQVEGNISANGIIAFLNKMCERLDYPQENIQFSIKETDKPK